MKKKKIVIIALLLSTSLLISGVKAFQKGVQVCVLFPPGEDGHPIVNSIRSWRNLFVHSGDTITVRYDGIDYNHYLEEGRVYVPDHTSGTHDVWKTVAFNGQKKGYQCWPAVVVK